MPTSRPRTDLSSSSEGHLFLPQLPSLDADLPEAIVTYQIAAQANFAEAVEGLSLAAQTNLDSQYVEIANDLRRVPCQDPFPL